MPLRCFLTLFTEQTWCSQGDKEKVAWPDKSKQVYLVCHCWQCIFYTVVIHTLVSSAEGWSQLFTPVLKSPCDILVSWLSQLAKILMQHSENLLFKTLLSKDLILQWLCSPERAFLLGVKHHGPDPGRHLSTCLILSISSSAEVSGITHVFKVKHGFNSFMN